MSSYRGIVGLPSLEYSSLAVSRRRPPGVLNGSNYGRRNSTTPPPDDAGLCESENYSLPPFTRILNLSLGQNQIDEGGSKTFITNVGALHDVAFSPKCPILGTGHHFAVYASPFEPSDHDFTSVDGRAFNNQVYCLKAPNFISAGSGGSGLEKSAFRKEYYDTVLQELRVLLHPELHRHENIISLFGLDFQEDYDDCNIAWPIIIMENAEHGTLDTLQRDIHLGPDLSRALLLDVARGIQALHQCDIIHGDVKSENVLICRHASRSYVARLSDFGLSLVHPDVASDKHHLPGGTFLWRAPEFDHDLSVDGLRQTDVYSFGLMAWRVLTNNPNPYSLIPRAALDLQPAAKLSEIVTRAKEHPAFCQLVLQSMEAVGVSHIYALRIVEASLGMDPESRDLSRLLSLFAGGPTHVTPALERSEAYWAMEEPSLVMEQLEESFPDKLLQYTFKASVIRSLLCDLEAIFQSSGSIARSAGWLLFKFAASPQFQVARKTVGECCQILINLCNIGSALGQAIVASYHRTYSKDLAILDSEWLEVAAMNGSYYAMESMRECYPEKYVQLMGGPLDFEPRAEDLEEDEINLLTCCRLGDYETCKMMLNAGASAFPSQEGMVSALHWLVSFQDERQVHHMAELLLSNGAVLHAWEGEDDDFAFGRVHGTPLHWAIWHRNIFAVAALTKAERQPEVKQIERAIWLAATMHFYDVLEILKAWILGLNGFAELKIDWHPAFLFAIDQSGLWLPRRLRNDNSQSGQALERTLDVVLIFYTPVEQDFKVMFACGKGHNQPALLRYMYARLELGKRKDFPKIIEGDPGLEAIAMGFIGVIDVFIEQGLISPQSEHGVEKWRPLQMCGFTRQRDPIIAKRFLEIGCPVDGVGGTDESNWTPFFIAVALGMYQIAVMFLEHGANKDHVSGWLGGSTVTMNLLQQWPDIPLSRLKFMLEEVPRLGFGHVTFWGWPGAGGNLIYALSMQHWSSYAAGYRLGETAKYILSQLADKSCLNIIDKVGATALRMACAGGNVEIIRALIEAGQDVNLAMGFSPLRNAKEWLATCQKRERESLKGKPGSERRLARLLRERAEETIELLVSHGAVDRGVLEAINQGREFLASGQWQKPSMETVFEMFSGAIDPSPRVETGSTPLQPTTRDDFRAHHGRKSALQKKFGSLGRQIDQAYGQEMQKPTPRYQPHNCLPWRSDNCTYCFQFPTTVPGHGAPAACFPVTQRQPSDRAALSSGTLSNVTSPAVELQPLGRGPTIPESMQPTVYPEPQWQNITSNSSRTMTRAANQIPPPAQWQPPSPSPGLLRTAEAVEKEVYHALLHYFCEGGGENSSKSQKRGHTVELLKGKLDAPILLGMPRSDIEQCEEFLRISKAVDGCLEIMNVCGVSLVPELSDNGRELVIHVFS